MENTKITNHQLFSLIASVAIGGAIIVSASPASSVAKQDAWLGALLTPLLGLPVIWLYWYLGKLYPDLTLIGMIKKILGKWIGTIVSVSFIFFCFSTCSRIIWYVSDFITIQSMPETPEYIINLVFVTAMVIALLYGLDVIARTSEIFVYFASLLFLLAMILVLPNARIENLQPMFQKGIFPILKSSVPISCFITFTLIPAMMIYPINVKNITTAKKFLFKGYLWCAFCIFVSILMSILVLGSSITSYSRYPAYLLAREINLGTVFTRLEFAIATSWLVTEFVTSTIYFYASVKGISELLGLKDHKKIVLPLGIITLIMTGISYPNVAYQLNWSRLVWIPYSVSYGLILPVLLLLVFLVKKLVFRRT